MPKRREENQGFDAASRPEPAVERLRRVLGDVAEAHHATRRLEVRPERLERARSTFARSMKDSEVPMLVTRTLVVTDRRVYSRRLRKPVPHPLGRWRVGSRCGHDPGRDVAREHRPAWEGHPLGGRSADRWHRRPGSHRQGGLGGVLRRRLVRGSSRSSLDGSPRCTAMGRKEDRVSHLMEAGEARGWHTLWIA
jgi:hypothetical protein